MSNSKFLVSMAGPTGKRIMEIVSRERETLAMKATSTGAKASKSDDDKINPEELEKVIADLKRRARAGDVEARRFLEERGVDVEDTERSAQRAALRDRMCGVDATRPIVRNVGRHQILTYGPR